MGQTLETGVGSREGFHFFLRLGAFRPYVYADRNNPGERKLMTQREGTMGVSP